MWLRVECLPKVTPGAHLFFCLREVQEGSRISKALENPKGLESSLQWLLVNNMALKILRSTKASEFCDSGFSSVLSADTDNTVQVDAINILNQSLSEAEAGDDGSEGEKLGPTID